MSAADLARASKKIWKPDPYRWVNLLLFVMCTTGQFFCASNFSPISALLAGTYRVNDTLVNYGNISFNIAYILMIYPCFKALDSGKLPGKGMATSFRISAAVTLVSVWCRYFAANYSDTFGIVMLP